MSKKSLVIAIYAHQPYIWHKEDDFISQNEILYSAISETFKTTVEINPLILQQSIQKVSVIITQKISVIMEILENKVNLYCESTLGKVKDTIMAKTNGDQLEKIAFNNKFMLDALKHCQTEKIIIGFNGPVMPIIIKPLKGEDFLYLILPIRLR